ncbi:MAG: L-threonylcarbamoyladenylate synthase [Bacteroidetes bacterium]|nr:L-threonylcarbamoyladenylate synthase [Bacteroidota bacterium]
MEEEIKKCVHVLKHGGTILYPTDTIWGIGCDATNRKAVDKIYRLKKRLESKSLIILLDESEKLKHYVRVIPEIAWDLLEIAGSPITIIYPGAMNLAKNVLAEDNSIAIRIVKNEFCRRLIHDFDKPIVSSSANISGEPTPMVFKNISRDISGSVDYVVNLYQDQFQELKPSRIIKLNVNGEFHVLRP